MAPRRSQHWPGTTKARCWHSPRRMVTPGCWSFKRRFRREQCVPPAVVLKQQHAVKNMSPDDRKRAYRREMLVASAMVVAGLAISAVSVAQLKTGNPDAQMAQATQ